MFLPQVMPFSLPENYRKYKAPKGQQHNHVNSLIEVVKASTKADSPEQIKENFRSIIFVIHKYLTKKIDITLFIEQIDRLLTDSTFIKVADIRLFVEMLVAHGNLSAEALLDLKYTISRKVPLDAYTELAKRIDALIEPPVQVVLPTTKAITPTDDMLAWMNKKWDAVSISAVLTELCMPFYKLRAGEFVDEQNSGPNLHLLLKRCQNLTNFVSASILSAAAGHSHHRSKKVVAKWLNIASSLNERNNFHMMFAIHAGLHANAVERLDRIFEDMDPKRSKKTFDELNTLFNIVDRMKLLNVKTEELAGKACAIPCIQWLYTKALQSREADLYLADGSINTQQFVSAGNIFRNMAKMQTTPYDNLKPNSEVLSYFQNLDDEGTKIGAEQLQVLSESIKPKKACSLSELKNEPKPKKSSSFPGLKYKPVSYKDVFEKKRSLLKGSLISALLHN